jgi:exopolyphosphatase/guanosine-5'-triphosphate,3'-diphosphate pyrophosphatase
MTTRLGAGLVKTGCLCPAGKQATLEAVSHFSSLAQRVGAIKISAFGTSAMREAVDGKAFARLLEAETGLHIEVLSPETEAVWGYTGVAKSLPKLDGALVFDLGGGSCELTWQSSSMLLFRSLKIGAVYLTDKYFHHDPPLIEEIATARDHIRKNMASTVFPPVPIVGVGGTVTSLASMAMEMAVYDRERIHGYQLTRQDVDGLLQDMLAKKSAERQKMRGLQAGRAAILPAGTLVVDTLMEVSGASAIHVSEGDLLLGSLYAVIGLA